MMQMPPIPYDDYGLPGLRPRKYEFPGRYGRTYIIDALNS
jgi:hypothetical protein